MFRQLREDIACIQARDPAARSAWEVLTCYPGLHVLQTHRLAHWLWGCQLKWLGRFVSHLGRWLTGIEIHPGAVLGRRVFIDHGMGVVIGEMAEVGDGCTIYQGVTLGGTSLVRGAKRHPTLGAGVIVGANACILGGFTVGAGARIGSGAIVTKSVPSGATVVGNPARIIPPPDDVEQAKAVPSVDERESFTAYGLCLADDPVSLALKSLINHADGHEHQIALLWAAIEKIRQVAPDASVADCVPQDAKRVENFDAAKLNKLMKS